MTKSTLSECKFITTNALQKGRPEKHQGFQTVFFRSLTSAGDRGKLVQRDKDCLKTPVFPASHHGAFLFLSKNYRDFKAYNSGGHLKKCRSPGQEKCRKSASESAGPKRGAEESAEKSAPGSRLLCYL